LSGAGVVHGTPLPAQRHTTTSFVSDNADLHIEAASNVTNAILTASTPGTGRGWSHWHAGFRVKKSGMYEISVRQIGDTWLYLNGRTLLASPGLHAPDDMTAVVRLRADKHYSLKARWFSVIRQGPPELGVVDVTSQIRTAVAVARRSQVAVVFASEPSSEGGDQTSFNLPGDEDALIEAVAKANAHTIVVLDTGNAVLMPWLDHVQGVLEAWYPGEEDGTAIANVLTGVVDPSGRLPITFPASPAAQPVAAATQFPGVDDRVSFGVGNDALDVGYRWYQAHDVEPLFPFGFGLDYTTFDLSDANVRVGDSSLHVDLRVTNTGDRTGADVVQAYVRDPSSAGEPPEQLRAFIRVVLPPSSHRYVTLAIPLSSLDVYDHGRFELDGGEYVVGVGQSPYDLPLSVQFRLH
jgi:beta-glucosidase